MRGSTAWIAMIPRRYWLPARRRASRDRLPTAGKSATGAGCSAVAEREKYSKENISKSGMRDHALDFSRSRRAERDPKIAVAVMIETRRTAGSGVARRR